MDQIKCLLCGEKHDPVMVFDVVAIGCPLMDFYFPQGAIFKYSLLKNVRNQPHPVPQSPIWFHMPICLPC